MPKNFRKIPVSVEQELNRIAEDSIAVGCAVMISAENLRKGELRHLGVGLDPTKLTLPAEVIPPSSCGKYCRRNQNGFYIIRKSLGLKTYYHSVEAPNWGDMSRGTHTVDLPHKAYPRDFQSPQLLAIRIHCDNPALDRTVYTFSFRLDIVLDRTAKTFRTDLLAALNLLQEAVGATRVYPASTSVDEYKRSLKVAWEILPPGTKDEAVAQVFRNHDPSDVARRVVEDRFDFLQSLNPKNFVIGHTGLQRYFGALLEEDLVVFENITYGNAIYIMFKDWPTLSQRTRVELLSGRYGTDFERVPHVKQWKNRINKIVAHKRSKESGTLLDKES